MKKSGISIFIFGIALLVSANAQSLAPGANKPVADGILEPGEYAKIINGADMRLGLSVSSDGKTLYLALEAPTEGWVAIGLGSSRMNGAFMVLGFDAKGRMTISEETGSGHSHKPNAVKTLTAAFVKETAGKTVLEAALPAARYLAGSSLSMILAYGQRDNLNSIHSGYLPVNIPL